MKTLIRKAKIVNENSSGAKDPHCPDSRAGDFDLSAHQCLSGGDCRCHGCALAHDLPDGHRGHPDHRQGPGAGAGHRRGGLWSGRVHHRRHTPAVLELEGPDRPMVGQVQARRGEPAGRGGPGRAPAVGLGSRARGHPRRQGDRHLRHP